MELRSCVVERGKSVAEIVAALNSDATIISKFDATAWLIEARTQIEGQVIASPITRPDFYHLYLYTHAPTQFSSQTFEKLRKMLLAENGDGRMKGTGMGSKADFKERMSRDIRYGCVTREDAARSAADKSHFSGDASLTHAGSSSASDLLMARCA